MRLAVVTEENHDGIAGEPVNVNQAKVPDYQFEP